MAKKSIEVKKEKDSSLIYCGPSVPNKGLIKYSVFIGGFPEHLNTLFEKCPAVKELIVPVEELSTIRQNIEKKGSYENMLYNEVLKYVSEVNK